MINFNLKAYQWHQDMNIIMQNVNLERIEFLNDRSMSFCFLNSYDGGFCRKILCKNVWKFSEDINLDRNDTFPFFICDVKTIKLEKSNVEDAFRYFRYSLEIPKSNNLYLLCMDSGDISIALICEVVEVL